MNYEREIVIAGGGVAGISLATRCAQKGISTGFVIAEIPTSSPSLDRRMSAPIVTQRTLVYLGIRGYNRQIDQVQFGLQEKDEGTHSSLRSLFPTIQSTPGYAVDLAGLEYWLFERLNMINKKNGNPVEIFNARATHLNRTSSRVTGVHLNDGRLLQSLLVVDATGRNARLTSQLDPSEIEVKKISQDSTILGGYVTINNPEILEKYPGLTNKMILGLLPRDILAIIAPCEKVKDTSATHLLLFEGTSDAIQQVLKQATGSSLAERRLDAMKALSHDTKWEDMVESIDEIDRIISFHSKDAVRRHSKIKGLLPFGDAGHYVNPAFATSIRRIAKDGIRLTEYLSSYPHDLDQAVKEYSAHMRGLNSKRLIRSQILFSGFKRLQQIHNTIMNVSKYT